MPAQMAENAVPGPTDEPYIPAAQSIPELTVRAVILGVILAVVLAAANAYLGLFAGMTVSASIPAAVISMVILRALRGGNILENNLVQTAASAGESLVAGVIFTLPAMVIGAHWGNFNYVTTSLIACFGGLLGVMFTIPLRRAMIVEQPLQFPEGVATAEVLKVGDRGGASIRGLLVGGLLGALFKLCASGFRVFEETIKWGANVGGNVATVSLNASPALVAVGYIVGLNIAVLVFVGGAINWWIAIPAYIGIEGVDTSGGAMSTATAVWGAKTRYIGVGAMAVGGVWALIRMRSSLFAGISSGMEAYRRLKQGGADVTPRTERDTPMQWVAIAALVAVVPLIILFQSFTHELWVSVVMAVVMIVAGFLFSAVAAYMAGLVGSSNNPISGVTIATVLSASLLLLMLLGAGNTVGPVAAILIGGCVCCAAAIGGDNMQDLKAGHIVGATPWKQQVMQVIGVIAAAFAIAPILTLLHTSYGIGPKPVGPSPVLAHADSFERVRSYAPDVVGMVDLAKAASDSEQPALSAKRLQAPQASLTEAVSKVSRGISNSGLPWTMIFIGMGLAVLIILIDLGLEARGSSFRAPVLAVAVGVYLPFYLSLPIFFGGALAWAVKRYKGSAADRKSDEQSGLLFSAGVITGEALAGIALAIPIAATSDIEVLQLIPGGETVAGIFGPGVPWVGLLLLAAVMWLTYQVATAKRRNAP